MRYSLRYYVQEIPTILRIQFRYIHSYVVMCKILFINVISVIDLKCVVIISGLTANYYVYSMGANRMTWYPDVMKFNYKKDHQAYEFILSHMSHLIIFD